MNKKILFILAAICLFGCNKNNPTQQSSSSVFSEEEENIPNEKAKQLYYEAIEFAKKENPQKEFELLLKADSISPNTPAILTNIGTTYAESGDMAKAVEYYKKSLAIDSGYSKTYVNYTKLLIMQNKFEEAVIWGQKGLAIDSLPELNKKMLLLNLANSYYGLKDYPLALKTIEEAKKYKKGYAEDRIANAENQLKNKMNNE
ncbi:MAG: tetratricopeptide repeat protein [Prevotellaceae bacterium]|jgi:tetratricopeptide (TPR) repeat protein|nr:tetratricopeptide repeat protein [Prevotellaceae bacterium]